MLYFIIFVLAAALVYTYVALKGDLKESTEMCTNLQKHLSQEVTKNVDLHYDMADILKMSKDPSKTKEDIQEFIIKKYPIISTIVKDK